MADDCQRKTNNPVLDALDQLLVDTTPKQQASTAGKPAYADALETARAKIPDDEAHNAKRLHTRNKRPYRQVGATIDEWRRTPEGKAARNADQRAAYAAVVEATENRPVATYKKNPTAGDRKAQEAAASKRYREKKKAEKEAKLAARAIV